MINESEIDKEQLNGLSEGFLQELYKSSLNYNQDKVFSQNEKKIILSPFESYLSSLNVYLDDNSFKQKCQKLPKINSTVITKIEKAKENQEGADLPGIIKEVQVKPQISTSKKIFFYILLIRNSDD